MDSFLIAFACSMVANEPAFKLVEELYVFREITATVMRRHAQPGGAPVSGNFYQICAIGVRRWRSSTITSIPEDWRKWIPSSSSTFFESFLQCYRSVFIEMISRECSIPCLMTSRFSTATWSPPIYPRGSSTSTIWSIFSWNLQIVSFSRFNKPRVIWRKAV